jgi:hypothetical protein
MRSSRWRRAHRAHEAGEYCNTDYLRGLSLAPCCHRAIGAHDSSELNHLFGAKKLTKKKIRRRPFRVNLRICELKIPYRVGVVTGWMTVPGALVATVWGVAVPGEVGAGVRTADGVTPASVPISDVPTPPTPVVLRPSEPLVLVPLSAPSVLLPLSVEIPLRPPAVLAPNPTLPRVPTPTRGVVVSRFRTLVSSGFKVPGAPAAPGLPV